MTQPDGQQPQRYVGQSIRRIGDSRLLTGVGRYVDDIHLPETLHLALVRSPYAHAEIGAIDRQAAESSPGIHSVYTGAELAELTNPQTSEDLPPERALRRYPLAVERARFVGDAVAAVLADDRYRAADAAELVEVDYQPLPAVVDAEAALASDAPLVYPEWGDNLAYRWQVESGDVDGALERADREVSLRLVNQRLYAAFIEPRAVLASYEPVTGEMTVWASTQTPHRLRTGIAAAIGLPEHHIRVIAPDVGGGFGAKGPVYPEYLVAAALAYRLGRPVKWVETRRESLLATNHARDQVQKLRAAVMNDGTVAALEVEIIANLGAYTAAVTPLQTGRMSVGTYRIQNLRTQVLGVMTNTTPTGAYRGAGRPEAAYMLDRLMDRIAQELGLDPAEVKRRNFIPPEAFPYKTPTGLTYDSGNYAAVLDEALRRLDYPALRREQQRARDEGRLVGIGIAMYCELAGPGWDSGSVRVQPSGTVLITTGISPHGQGEETTFRQIVADELGVPLDDIAFRASDTAVTPQGIGTFGSRGTSIGGSAVLLAARQVRDKARQIAAQMLEASEDDIDVEGGRFSVRGAPNRSVTLKQVARAAYAMAGVPGGLEPGLDATCYFTPSGRTIPFGAHAALVEVDPVTGEVCVRRYLAVDDCGPLINPQIVEGQVVGGLAQGFGQALFEGIIYDDNGQMLTGSLMDYAVPRSHYLPSFETAHTVTPSPVNPLGVKGVGEAGTTGAPPTLVNAVLDALAPLGVRHIDMPLSAQTVWRAIRAARG